MSKPITYEDVLSTGDIDDLPDELQLPTGTWRFVIRARTPKEDHILLTLSPLAPCDDVDPTELDAWEEGKEDDPVVFHRLRGAPRNAGAQLKSLCRMIGVTSLQKLIDTECYATVIYDANKKDPQRPWQRLKGFQPITEDPRAIGG